jgi:hypothetical protein
MLQLVNRRGAMRAKAPESGVRAESAPFPHFFLDFSPAACNFQDEAGFGLRAAYFSEARRKPDIRTRNTKACLRFPEEGFKGPAPNEKRGGLMLGQRI